MVKIYRAYYYRGCKDWNNTLMYREAFSTFKQAKKDVERILMYEGRKDIVSEEIDEKNGTYKILYITDDARGFKHNMKIEIHCEEGEAPKEIIEEVEKVESKIEEKVKLKKTETSKGKKK
jgi:hypothetical protein